MRSNAIRLKLANMRSKKAAARSALRPEGRLQKTNLEPCADTDGKLGLIWKSIGSADFVAIGDIHAINRHIEFSSLRQVIEHRPVNCLLAAAARFSYSCATCERGSACCCQLRCSRHCWSSFPDNQRHSRAHLAEITWLRASKRHLCAGPLRAVRRYSGSIRH